VLLVDDLLLAPIRGLLWVFEKIHDAAQEEIAGEADAITAELRELYMMLETGRITEVEFSDREGTLLDRLDATQERGSEVEEEDFELDEEDQGEEDEDEGDEDEADEGDEHEKEGANDTEEDEEDNEGGGEDK
jgi:hypothetical protein